MNDQKISPELKRLLESLQETPERDLQASHVGRENYLIQIRNLKPRRGKSLKAARHGSSRGRHTWVTRFAVVAAVFMIALSGFGGTIYAAQAAQPDDLLYSVKTLTEQIRVRVEKDPEDKLDLYVSFANRRMQEIQNQLTAGEEVSGKTLVLLEDHTQKMLEQAAMLDANAMNKALRQIEENLQLQNQLMIQLGKEHPQHGPPGLLHVGERIRERLELVENGISQPEGFREKMRIEQQGDSKGIDSPSDPEGGPGGTGEPGNGPGNGSGGK
jgi:hypothetical protein